MKPKSVQKSDPAAQWTGALKGHASSPSYLDFASPLPFSDDDGVIERGVLNEDGRISGRAQAAVRALSPSDFDRIIARGLDDHTPLLPRTDELGPQSEIELQQKLSSEVEAERLTRLDRLLIQEQQREGFVDLFTSGNRLIQENRDVLIGRLRKLEGYGLAREEFAGEWIVSSRTEATLNEIEARNDVIRSMQQALNDNGLGDERGTSQFVRHGQEPEQTLAGRVLGKGLAGDGLSETTYLVLDGVDARVHHVEFPDAARLDGLQRGMIVEVTPPITQPRTVDLNIQQNTDADGIYSPSTHLARIRERFTEQGKDPEAYIRSHVRRLEALRRARHVERVHAEHWTIPKDLAERGLAYDRSLAGEGPGIRIASQLSLDCQIGADGVTWLDREIVAPTPRSPDGFGREVSQALDQRRNTLVEMGLAKRQPGGGIEAPNLLSRLQRREVEGVATDLAKSTGLSYRPSSRGEYVSGTVTRQLQLVSGRSPCWRTGSASSSCLGSRCWTSRSAAISPASGAAMEGSSGTSVDRGGWDCN